MPVPAKYKCRTCKGESDVPRGEPCLPCECSKQYKWMDGAKHIPSSFFKVLEKEGERRMNNEQNSQRNS